MAEGTIKISVIILARNEAQRINRCINSVKWADEIIVIDNCSLDRTAEVAGKAGARVFTVRSDDFSELRNTGKAKARGEWIFYLDADEQVTPQLASEIKQVVRRNQGYRIYFVRRRNYYFGNHLFPREEKLERLFRADSLEGWTGKVHESPRYIGQPGILDHPINHYTHRNFEEMLAKTNQWSNIEAQLRFDAGHPRIAPWRILRVMYTGFSDSYFRQAGWKAGMWGIVEGMYQAFSIFITYAKLWELQNKNGVNK